MAIKITEEEDIFLTRAKMEALLPEYRASQAMTTKPVSFETWLRRRSAKEAVRGQH